MHAPACASRADSPARYLFVLQFCSERKQNCRIITIIVVGFCNIFDFVDIVDKLKKKKNEETGSNASEDRTDCSMSILSSADSSAVAPSLPLDM